MLDIGYDIGYGLEYLVWLWLRLSLYTIPVSFLLRRRGWSDERSWESYRYRYREERGGGRGKKEKERGETMKRQDRDGKKSGINK